MTKVLNEVNKVYKKENPSAYIKLTKKNILNLKKSREKLLLNLKFPKKMFINTNLLDLGSGSGIYSLIYNLFGSNCTLVEYEKSFVSNSKKLFKKFSKNKFSIINSDIFKFKKFKKYDIVIFNGVGHHTHDPDKALNIACRYVQRGGFIIYGIGNKSGFFQRAIQRLILFNISKNDMDIVKYSKLFFKQHLNRASKFGGRSINQIIYDTYVNSKIDNHSIKDILQIFNKNKIKLYSSFPEILEMNSIFSSLRTQHKNFNYLSSIKNKKNIFLSEHQWMTFTNYKTLGKIDKKKMIVIENLKNSIAGSLNDKSLINHRVNYLKLISEIKKYKNKIKDFGKVKILDIKHQQSFFIELIRLLNIIKDKKINQNIKIKKIKFFLKKRKYILKNHSGVGMTYYVGVKKN